MQNDAGENVDLYIPRKWLVAVDCTKPHWSSSGLHNPMQFQFYEHHKIILVDEIFVIFELIFMFPNIFSSASNRIIHAKDHASIQLNFADVDPQTGRMTETVKIYAISGNIRKMVIENDLK